LNLLSRAREEEEKVRRRRHVFTLAYWKKANEERATFERANNRMVFVMKILFASS
jgi:transcriptional regulator NrdR family protein